MREFKVKSGEFVEKGSCLAIIGSNSFTGASFVNTALTAGYKVLGISRSKELSSAYLPYKTNVNLKNFDFLQGNLNEDLDSITGELESFQPKYVVNFASQSMVAQSWDHPEHWFQTNVVGNIKFQDRLRKVKNLVKYVHISTPEVYGDCQGAVSENNNFKPSTPYAVSRAACDMSLLTFFSNYKFPVVFTRAANVYGPGQQIYRIVPRTILAVMKNEKFPLHGGGRSIRSFIHINDVCGGTLRAMESGGAGEVYHLSVANQISIRELVELICDQMGARFSQHVTVVDERPGKDAAYILDSSKARNELNWTDTVSLKDGIKETILWVEKNYEFLKNEPADYIHKP